MNNYKAEDILVVDDNVINLQLIRGLITPYGYKGRFVVSARRALDSIKISCPDLILLDITMPEINGFEFCEMLKSDTKTAEIPIIFLSALDGEKDIVKGFELGGVDYITKPFKEEVLLARVATQLNQKNLREDLASSNTLLKTEIKKRKQAQIVTEKSEQRLNAALEASNEGIWEWNHVTKKIFLSHTFYSMLGYGSDYLFEKLETWINIVHPKDKREFRKKIQSCIVHPELKIEHEYRIKKENGEYIWVLIKGRRHPTKESNSNKIFGTITNIDQQKKDEQRLKYMLHFDSLTGLPNRFYLHDLLNKSIALAKRNSTKLALLFLDLNRFKIINDSLGHSNGDILLIAVAKRLKEIIRDEDAVARLGGDEFTIFINNFDRESELVNVVERVINAFNIPFDIGGHRVVVGVSIGISIFPDDASNVENLLQSADTAMYRAKRQGTEGFSFYTEEMNRYVNDRLKIEQKLRKAIDCDDLVPFYQAKYNVKKQAHEGMETLCRWKDGDQYLSPALFMGIAFETGLIINIDHLIFKKAAIYAKSLQDKGCYPGRVAINISPLHFKQKNIIDQILTTLEETGLSPHLLELEITEEALVENIDHSIDVMKKLKASGISLALDDFGTGFSSLSYLCKFPIDTLKIDMSFIQDIHKSKRKQAIVKCIIELSHDLNISVVAEGVENIKQAHFLEKFGCDYIQGYLYSKPVKGDDFSASIVNSSLSKLESNIPILRSGDISALR